MTESKKALKRGGVRKNLVFSWENYVMRSHFNLFKKLEPEDLKLGPIPLFKKYLIQNI